MSVDLDKIKVGDEVVVRGVVDQLDPSALYRRVSVQFPAYTSGFWIPGEAVVSHTPKAIEVGDRVRVLHSQVEGEVVATCGEQAWVKSDTGKCLTWRFSHLERVND